MLLLHVTAKGSIGDWNRKGFANLQLPLRPEGPAKGAFEGSRGGGGGVCEIQISVGQLLMVPI